MPCYHFNVLDGVADYDEIGTEMAGIADAKREARRYAAGMLADSALIANLDNEWRIEVTDHRGLILISSWSDNARRAKLESLRQFSLVRQLHDTLIRHLNAVFWNSDKRIQLSLQLGL